MLGFFVSENLGSHRFYLIELLNINRSKLRVNPLVKEIDNFVSLLIFYSTIFNFILEINKLMIKINLIVFIW